MKYHFALKLLAFFLAACCLVTSLGSAAMIVATTSDGLYTNTPEEVEAIRISSWRHDQAYNLALRLLKRYTAVQLGQCSYDVLAYSGLNFTIPTLCSDFGLEQGSWDYQIEDLSGQVMQSNRGTLFGDLERYVFHMAVDYPVHSTSQINPIDWKWRDYYFTETEEHFLYYYESPTYQVTIRTLPGAFDATASTDSGQLKLLYSARYWVIAALGVSLLIFVLCAIYLCCAAGRSHRHDEIRLKGLTRLPLDLYGGVAVLACIPLLGFGVDCADNVRWATEQFDRILFLAAGIGLLFAAALVAGLWLYAVVAQIKMKNGTWWRRSFIGWCLRKLWKVVKFCFRGLRKLFGSLRKLFYMLPLIWQWLVTAAAMVVVPLFCLFLTMNTYNVFRILFALWTVAACLGDLAMVCYGAYAFGTLLKGAKQMSAGDLNAKIPTQYLFGAFRTFAEELNGLADAAMEAAKGQMKSERMKTELITNVSHDIKTPLTSLINYVDLLTKPHTQEEGQQYLEVLARQSQRLKKLIDDLMDMSKASSGTMTVDITQVDASEVLNQALGEFADKLEAQKLTPVFRQPAQPVMVRCDGRLTWRVMSNLLGNIVKYALPGTRVYMDVTQTESVVLISFKNISREELNVSADELTERFVRGDASRNTDGSGLGLNIAQSLMQLQQGSLQLLIDGDLFKVTLTFPAA